MDKLTAWIRYKGAFYLLELAYKSSSIAKRIPIFVRVIQQDQSIYLLASSAVVGYRENFDKKKLQNDGSGRPVLTLIGKRLEACKDFASLDPKLIRTVEGSQPGL